MSSLERLANVSIRIYCWINCPRRSIYLRILCPKIGIVYILWVTVFCCICCITIWRICNTLLIGIWNRMVISWASNICLPALMTSQIGASWAHAPIRWGGAGTTE
eukprot:Gb_26514 [translate_table: standard]